MKKASEVFKSIRFAKAEPRDKPHSSTDEEGHYTVGEKEYNQQLKHVKKMAMQEENNQTVEESTKGVIWRVESPKGHGGYSARHYVAKGYGKDMKIWKNKIGAGDFIKHEDAQAKAAELNRGVKEEIEQLDEMPGANMDTRAVHAHLKKKGWSLTRTSGSHDVYTHPDAEHHIAVPRHKQLKAPLVKGILKQSNVNEETEQMQESSHEAPPIHVRSLYTKTYAAHGGTASKVKDAQSKAYAEVEKKHGKPMRDKLEAYHRSNMNEEIQIDEEIIENALSFLKEGRPSQRHPLEGHEYHKKTDEQLRYIGKDAHEAAEAMKGHNEKAENKYRDQANDAATVRHWRQKNGTPDWYKKKYGHMKEEVEVVTEAEDPPFDPPYKKTPSTTTDKSGAKHTAMSRAKHLARQAMRKQSEKMKKPRIEEQKETELSPKTKIVRDALKDGKKKLDDKEKTAGGSDKFQADPELSSQIVKT